MKKYTVLLLCMACSIPLFSQIDRLVSNSEPPTPTQYKPCLDGVARWSLLHEGIDVGAISEDVVAYGDTIINNITYKKMFSLFSVYQSVDWTNPPNYNNYTRLHKYIRESGDASKLYIYNGLEDKEYLFSDIDLNVGDSLLLPYFIYWPDRYVFVDSIYFKDNLKHIVTDVEMFEIPHVYHEVRLTFIEGIGANSGWGDGGGRSGLVHCFQNQTLSYKYQFEDFDIPCGYSTPADVKNVLDEKFGVFVQNDNIHIVLSTEDNTKINIYNISGLLLFSKKFTERNITIPVSSFLKGVYIIKINYSDKTPIYTTKIIL